MTSGLSTRLVAIVAAVACMHAGASARSSVTGRAADGAREILIESNRQHRANSEEYLGELTVIARNGKERRKTWKSYRDGPPGSSDRLIRFLSPPDVRGVGYLAHHRPGKNPEEWLYLPSMKRERRIGSRDREAPFVGTSFNYEDLDLLEFDDTRYESSMLAPQTIDGAAMHVIELLPRTRSIYSKKILTIRKDNLCLLFADFFVAEDPAPAKRLTFANYATVDGYLVATRIEMADLRKHGRTIVVLRDMMLNRQQPRDRYTIHNLLREEEAASAIGAAPPSTARLSESRMIPTAPEWMAPRWTGGFSGYAEAKGFAFFGNAGTHDSSLWQWATVVARQTAQIGPARITGALRLEESSASHVGPLAFDPADRNPRRSPVSVRELSVVFPLRPGLDVQAGRFQMAWGETDGYSPSDAFLPRDLTDPLAEERLPLWGGRVRGEINRVRFELFVAPTTTPWRLPDLGSRPSPFSSLDVVVVERPWSVPRAGFEAARVTVTRDGWDIGGWARAGVRPAPVLDPHLDIAEQTDAGRLVPLDRHFANESAVGAQLSREVGGWVVRNEIGVFHSNDAGLGNAVIWSIGGSRIVGDGTFTATVAANAVDPPVNPLLLFDRALLPAAILAIRELEPWGSWRAAWLTTFHTVGGVLTAEMTKDVTDVIKITAGADLPHGAALSPAGVFSGGKRMRAAVRWSW